MADSSRCFRAPDVVPERLARLVVDQPMRVAVRRDLVTLFRNGRDERRKPFRDPAEDEERGRDTTGLEQAEQPLGVAGHTALEIFPAIAGDHAVERVDVEVVLDVDAHRVHDIARRGLDGRRHGQAPFRRMTVLIVSKMMKTSSAIDEFLM